MHVSVFLQVSGTVMINSTATEVVLLVIMITTKTTDKFTFVSSVAIGRIMAANHIIGE